MTRRQPQLSAGGFTLVEALVSITVTSIMVLLIGSFMVDNIKESALATSRTDVLREVQSSLDFAATDIRLSAGAKLANDVPDPNRPAGWVSNTSSTLVLTTPAQDSSHNLLFSAPLVTHNNNLVYFVQGGTLYKRVLANSVVGNAAITTYPAALATPANPADRELLHNVTGLTIRYLDNAAGTTTPDAARAIELHLTAGKTVYNTPVTADYTTTMVFRND